MKKLLKRTVTGLASIIATAIVTQWMTGQPLTGLTKLKGLSQTFIKSSVPAWAFSLVFLVALAGVYLAATRWLPKRKGRIHFVADANNFGWSTRNTNEIDVRLSGIFTMKDPVH